VLRGQGYLPHGGDDRWVWSNGGMIISRGKLKKLGEEPAPMPHRRPRISHGVNKGLNPRYRDEKSQSDS
jgi:hypothetical protein